MATGSLDRYAFISAKLRARIGQMLDDRQIEVLLRSQSLEELLHNFRDTAYEPLIGIYDQSGDMQRLEAHLFARSVRLHREVAGYMDGVHADVVMAFTRKLEVENLKGVIRLWFSNTVKHQNIDYRFGYLYREPIVSPIDWDRIVNASSFDQIIDTLSDTPYGDTLRTFHGETLAREGLFALEIALDGVWFHLLRAVVSKLPGRDRKLVESVLDRDADLKNIINLVRFGWLYRLPADRLRTMMFEGGTLTRTREFSRYLATESDRRSPVDLVGRRFPSLAGELREMGKSTAGEQTLRVERYLFDVRKKEFHTMLRGYPFSFGIILAYFFLEERQDKLIRALVNGMYYGWDAQSIRGFAV